MKVGIFGGSFNPVHLGHYEIVREVLNRQLVEKMIIVPAYQNPLKAQTPILPEKLRWKMLEKTFACFDQLEISDFEIKQKQLSYTYKTLDFYQTQLPNAQFFLIMGADAFKLFHKWSNPDKILSRTQLIVFPRPKQTQAEKPIHSPIAPNKIHWINYHIPEISATEIRNTSFDQLKKVPMLHPDIMELWKSNLGDCH